MRFDAAHLEACKRRIEAKFSQGSSLHWTTHDFNRLSEAIHQETGILLSVSTLKRIWQKVNHSSTPNQSTLNALAKFTGAADWRDFEKQQNPVSTKQPTASVSKNILWLGLVLLLIAGVAFSFQISKESEPVVLDDNPVFRGQVVSAGLPNSVVFTYNVTQIPAGAKVEIQQDWDPRKRFTVNRLDTVATSIYYKPGFFEAKLVINDSIYAETDVVIKNNAWLGVIEDTPSPVYLEPSEYKEEGRLQLSQQAIEKYKLGSEKERYWTGFYKVGGFPELYTNDFELETELTNISQDGFNICRNVRIALLYEGGALVVPLSLKGCASELSLLVFDERIDGKTNDLSKFGVDFEEGNVLAQLQITSHAEGMRITVNGETAFTYQKPPLERPLVGIAFNFEGLGRVKSLSLRNASGLEYTDTFE
ncbi:MAG: hypothetical protein AAGD88_05025 [Bacteroidota bacterium]